MHIFKDRCARCLKQTTIFKLETNIDHILKLSQIKGFN